MTICQVLSLTGPKSLDNDRRLDAELAGTPTNWEQRDSDSVNYTNYREIVTGALRHGRDNVKRKLSVEKPTPKDTFLPLPANGNIIPDPIVSWFGDEPDILEPYTSSEEEDEQPEEPWDGKVARQQRNKDKRKRALKRKENIVAATSSKAMHIIGVGPVTRETLNYHRKLSKNFAEAKVKAANEFFEHYLKFDREEIAEMDIIDTQVSGKGDDTLYISLKHLTHVTDVHRRRALVKNDKIHIRNFIPPQFHSRFMALNSACAELRSENEEIRTQMRFGPLDIEVWTKTRGTTDPFEKVNLNETFDMDSIPKYDFTKKWNKKVDRPPRRLVFDSPDKGLPPSMQPATKPGAKKPRKENTTSKPDMEMTNMSVKN